MFKFNDKTVNIVQQQEGKSSLYTQKHTLSLSLSPHSFCCTHMYVQWHIKKERRAWAPFWLLLSSESLWLAVNVICLRLQFRQDCEPTRTLCENSCMKCPLEFWLPKANIFLKLIIKLARSIILSFGFYLKMILKQFTLISTKIIFKKDTQNYFILYRVP